MEEFNRQKKVLNMMISMHSILRDRYKSLDLIANILLLMSSVIMNSLVFANDELYNFFSINSAKAKTIIGILSILIFAISLVFLLVNWKEKSNNHGDAVVQLSALLNECRAMDEIEDSEEKKFMCNTFTQKYIQVNNILVKIPDSKFNYLKYRHYKKIELSKLIDIYPGSPLIVLKGRLFLKSLKKREHA